MRIFLPNSYYHINCRGNNRESIFIYKRDYTRYINLLKINSAKYSVKVLAYCLMPNHIHLLSMPEKESAMSKFMQALNIAYAMYFNLRHTRIGHLFQGKFKSAPVENDEYLTHLSRYIHLNPSSAGIVKKPEGYLWSSYRHYLGFEKIDFVDPKPILKFFSRKDPIRDYKEFVDSQIDYQKEVGLQKLLLE